MLMQVLKEIENSHGAIRMDVLSRKLGIDPSVLEGMVEHWVRKGRIQRLQQDDLLCSAKACQDGCPFYTQRNCAQKDCSG
ncbi:MAG: FeoC-like transcriptional regulator [Chloroflexi bacterium]|nr:FeoC-like transcriptional regulator [Chloroflexota bacterium]